MSGTSAKLEVLIETLKTFTDAALRQPSPLNSQTRLGLYNLMDRVQEAVREYDSALMDATGLSSTLHYPDLDDAEDDGEQDENGPEGRRYRFELFATIDVVDHIRLHRAAAEVEVRDSGATEVTDMTSRYVLASVVGNALVDLLEERSGPCGLAVRGAEWQAVHVAE